MELRRKPGQHDHVRSHRRSEIPHGSARRGCSECAFLPERSRPLTWAPTRWWEGDMQQSWGEPGHQPLCRTSLVAVRCLSTDLGPRMRSVRCFHGGDRAAPRRAPATAGPTEATNPGAISRSRLYARGRLSARRVVVWARRRTCGALFRAAVERLAHGLHPNAPRRCRPQAASAGGPARAARSAGGTPSPRGLAAPRSRPVEPLVLPRPLQNRSSAAHGAQTTLSQSCRWGHR